ncbi:MAG: FAD:protein FMN transferase [Myxococcota bacterium]
MRRSVSLFALAVVVGCGGGETPERQAPPKPPPREAAKVPVAPPTPREVRPDERKGPPVRKDGTMFVESELMGTRISLNVFVGDEAKAPEAALAIRAAVDEMDRLEQILSEWRADSNLSTLSDAAGGPAVVIVPELFEVLERSKQIAEDTEGAFDPTFHGVGQLWSFKPGATPPTAKAVAAKLPLVDWTKLSLNAETRQAQLTAAGMKLGLGAIGKGFAADKASAVLKAKGFADHVIEVGGDTYAAGTKGGKPWMVGIQKPGARGALGAIPSSDQAVVTSGDYQRYFEHEGKRYAHILDPRTGWPIPAERSPKSVTLVAKNATDADAYCTAVAVMGVEAGMAFVEERDALEVVIITQDDEMRVSSGLQSNLVLPPNPPPPPKPAQPPKP